MKQNFNINKIKALLERSRRRTGREPEQTIFLLLPSEAVLYSVVHHLIRVGFNIIKEKVHPMFMGYSFEELMERIELCDESDTIVVVVTDDLEADKKYDIPNVDFFFWPHHPWSEPDNFASAIYLLEGELRYLQSENPIGKR